MAKTLGRLIDDTLKGRKARDEKGEIYTIMGLNHAEGFIVVVYADRRGECYHPHQFMKHALVEEKPKRARRRGQMLMPIDDYGRNMQERDDYLRHERAQKSKEHIPG